VDAHFALLVFALLAWGAGTLTSTCHQVVTPRLKRWHIGGGEEGLQHHWH